MYKNLFLCHFQIPGDEVHLPIRLHWEPMHNLMAQEFEKKGLPILEYTAFISLVATYFPHVKLPRNSRLGKCVQCSNFVQRRLNCSSKKRAAKLAEKRAKHLHKVMEERQGYWSRIQQAQQHPERYMSVILDQSEPVQLPALAYFPKSWIKLQKRMPMHVGGLIDHYFGKYIYYYPQFTFGKGPDLFYLFYNYFYLYFFKNKRIIGTR